MRIERLQVDGFGHFFKHPVGPLDAPLTILYGSNEAGKSTLLAFVRTMLFGFPASKQAQFYPPLNGGAHGGRITLVGNDGRQYIVERHAGPKGGTCNVTAGGQPVDDAAALGSLLDHASEGMYRAVFAFGLDELQNLKSLNQADVGGRIYSAGMGAESLPGAVASIVGRAAAIFTKGFASKAKVSESAAELDRVERGLDEAKGQAAEYGRLVTRRDEIAEELKRIRAKTGMLNALRLLIDRLRQAWEGLAEAKGNRDRLAEKVNEPLPDAAFLKDGDAIRRIQEGRKSFADSIRDLPKRQAELRSLKDTLVEMLRELGEGWDEDRLGSFDTSIPVRDAMGQWHQRLEEGERFLREAASGVSSVKKAVSDSAEKAAEARQAVEELVVPERDGDELEKLRRDLRSARTQVAEYRLARQRREELEQQASQAVPTGSVAAPWPVALLAAVVSVVAGLVVGRDAVVLGIGGGVVFAAAGAYLFLRRRPGGLVGGSFAEVLRRQLDAAARKEEVEAGRLGGLAAGLGLAEGLPSSQDLDEVEAGLDDAQEGLRLWDAAKRRVAEAEKEEKRARLGLEAAARLCDKSAEALAETSEGWRRWLASRGLPVGLLPVTVQDLLSRVEAARVQHGRVADMRRRIEAIENNIREYRDLVVPLARRHSIAAQEDNSDAVVRAAGLLVERHEAARDAERQRRQGEEALKDAQALVDRREEAVAALRVDLGKLMEMGGRANPEEERHYESLLGDVAVATPELLEARAEVLKPDLEESEARRSELEREEGSVATQIQHLVGDEGTSELRARRAVLVEQLQAKAREWAALTLAKALLERTSKKFEEERQPDVIKHAQGFFETVTHGRYRRLVSPLGSQTVTVEQQDGRTKTPEQLSGGTQEQLYLALRFGLIREFGERATRLPVVVDEVLVNFDPDRARRAAEAFGELARTNQVLVFTCHPETVEMFKDVCADARIIEIAAPDLFTSGGP